MHQRFLIILLSVLLLIPTACTDSGNKSNKKASTEKIVKKKRSDGTLASVSPVDEEGFVHGVKVNFYGDGTTVHSKVTYEHGVKQGPAIWMYQNGQVFEHTNFKDGERDGLTKKYHKTGRLLSECSFKDGEALPGLTEYDELGNKVSSYPTVTFRKIDKLAFENKVILEITSSIKSDKVRYYYLVELDSGSRHKSFINSSQGVARLEFFVAPGDVLMKKIELYAELPTKLGNTLVKKFSYNLAARNR